METPEMMINIKLPSPSNNLFDNQPKKSSRVDQILSPLKSDWSKAIDVADKLRIRKVGDAAVETLMFCARTMVTKCLIPSHSACSSQYFDYLTGLNVVKSEWSCHSTR